MSKSGDTMITHSQNITLPSQPAAFCIQVFKLITFQKSLSGPPLIRFLFAWDTSWCFEKYTGQAKHLFQFTKQTSNQWDTDTSKIDPVLKCYESRTFPSTLFQFVFFFLNFELCCGIFLQLSFQFCHGQRSQFIGFLVWFQWGLEGSSFSSTSVQDEKPHCAWWHSSLLLKHSPFPPVYLLPLGKHQQSLPAIQTNSVCAGRDKNTVS